MRKAQITGILIVTVLLFLGACAPIKEMQLKYDDGFLDGFHASRGWGYLVQFSPPSTPFTITKVEIFGNLYGTGYENQSFIVEVWDMELGEIHSMSYPHTEFSHTPGWVKIDITDVVVSGSFYIHLVTDSPREGGVQIAYDSSVKNEHSEMTKNWKITEDWPESVTKEEVNWMIRVIGGTK